MQTTMSSDDVVVLSWARLAAETGLARQIRERARLSQVEVASACQSTHSAVSRWEAGLRAPQGAAGLRYARLLERLARETSAA